MELRNYIKYRLSHGKCYFTLSDAAEKIGKSKKAIVLSISRLVKRGDIVSPARGFYLIIPSEYAPLGCLPSDEFIPHLMRFLDCKYYAGLLTAASYYGAAHQAPQIFQVITKNRLRAITCGRMKIQFIKSHSVEEVPTTTISTPQGRLIISTAEATAMDLVKFSTQSGGLHSIATILTELKDSMRKRKLNSILQKMPGLAWKQRLGYILDRIGARDLANVIKNYLLKQPRVDYILLDPSLKKSKKTIKSKTWKIVENITLESDI